MNPCGRPVDIGNRSYRTMARVFEDSDELVEIQWFPADPGADFLPQSTCITSLVWATEPWRQRPIGEEYRPRRRYIRKDRIPGAVGPHFCGTIYEFRNGCEYRPDLPPVLYRDDGLPLCCNPFWLSSEGGLKLGGSEVVSSSGGISSEGGLKLGGSEVVNTNPKLTSAGGIRLGGRDLVWTDATIRSEGGLRLGGSAEVVAGGLVESEGGLRLGGSAEVVAGGLVESEGGLRLGGSDSEIFGCEQYLVLIGGTITVIVNRTGPRTWAGGDLVLEYLGGLHWVMDDTVLVWHWDAIGWDGQGTWPFVPIGAGVGATVSCDD